jgi:hypothetical protein
VPRGGFRPGAGRKKKIPSQLAPQDAIHHRPTEPTIPLQPNDSKGHQATDHERHGSTISTDDRSQRTSNGESLNVFLPPKPQDATTSGNQIAHSSLDHLDLQKGSKEEGQVNDHTSIRSDQGVLDASSCGRSELCGQSSSDQIKVQAIKEPNQKESKEVIKEESKGYVENPNNACNTISERQSVEPLGRSHGIGTESGSIHEGKESSEPGMGGSDRGSSGQAQGLHAERRLLEQPSIGLGGATSNRDGVQDSEQILSESNAGRSGEHSEQYSKQRPSPGDSGQAPKLSIDEQLRLLRNPVHFCQTFCASHPYVEWQRAFLRDIQVVRDDGRLNLSEWPRTVVLAAVNGSGKTEILADVIRYLLSTVPGCVIPITSPIYRQLEMLENYLKSQNHKFPGWTCVEGKLSAPNGNFARWFATDTPTSVESFHGNFLVRIIEEAKAFDDELWDNTNRWQPKLTIIVSSKGLTKGRLYESLTKHRSFNRIHDIDASMCPWIPKKWIEEQIAQHGRDSSIIKSMIFNEFSDVDIKNLISLDQLNRCKRNPQPWRNPGFRVGGIDLSSAREGADKLPCVVRQGNKIFEPYFVPTCKSTMEAVGYITNWIKREQLKIVHVDNGGLGGIVMIDMLMQNFAGDKSVEIYRVNFGADALNQHSNCKNRATELWSNGAHLIEMRDLIFQWTDKAWSEFVTQVTSREVEVLNTGEIRLQSKQKMATSPDLADATFLALIEPDYERKSVTGLGKTNWANFKEGDSSSNRGFGITSTGRKLGRG